MTPAAKSAVLILLGTLERGGSETKFAGLATRLRRAGHDVHVAYFEPPEDLLPALKDVPTICLQRHGKWSLRAFRRMREYVSRNSIGTIVAVNFYPLAYAVPLAMSRNYRDLVVISSINTSELASARERIFMHLYRWLLRSCDQIVFGSQSQRDIWIARYGLAAERSSVIYNGVNPDVFDPHAIKDSASNAPEARQISDSEFVIVSVGRLRPEKAQLNLVHAMSMLRDHYELEPHLLLVGDGPERDRIHQEILAQDLTERVHLVGAVQDVRPYLEISDLFVLASYTETFSNAALEAAAMGLPVVLSDVGGAREMFPPGSGGTTFPADSIYELTRQLAEAANGGKLTDAIRSEIRNSTLARFSSQAMDDAWAQTFWSPATATPMHQDTVQNNKAEN